MFPRKKKRPRALAAWTKQGCEGIAARVIAGLRVHLPELATRPPDKVPYPASWLNDREWEDEPISTAPALPAKVAASRAVVTAWVRGRANDG